VRRCATPRRPPWRCRCRRGAERSGPGACPRDLLDGGGDQRGPSRLMTRAAAASGIAVEVLVEQHEVTEVRIIGIAPGGAVRGSLAGGVGEKEARQPAAKLERGL